MANRYTDSTKWDGGWFRWLEPKFKLAWIYLTDRCSGAGVLRVDMRTLSSFVGLEITEEEFREVFKGKVFWLENDRLWIPSYLQFQNKIPKVGNGVQRHVTNQFLELCSLFPIDDKTKIYQELCLKKLNELRTGPARASYGPHTGPNVDVDVDVDVVLINSKKEDPKQAEPEPPKRITSAQRQELAHSPLHQEIKALLSDMKIFSPKINRNMAEIVSQFETKENFYIWFTGIKRQKKYKELKSKVMSNPTDEAMADLTNYFAAALLGETGLREIPKQQDPEARSGM